MNFRLPMLLLTVSLLAGCSHLRSTGETPPLADESQTASQPVDESLSSVDDDDVEVSDHKQPEEQAITEEPDLLNRIRAGFRLPDFQSKHLAQYEKWNSSHPTYLNDLFARAEPFLYHIVEQLEARGMPLELALLPAVESAYKPEAESRSAAAGLWQFVPATGRDFGLYQNWWYDGRLDPLAATEAALDYLQQLNAMFDGDWLLTLAAYNAGQGTIKKAIKYNQRKKRKTRFQDLKLRHETTRYVPKLFALRNIVANPEKYGVSLPKISNRPYFAVLDIPGQIDLQRFSVESGIGIGALRHINAGHRRWATAPDGPHRLLVPLVAQQRAVASLQRLAQEPSIRYESHAIRRGDTLSAIARRYNVPVTAIQQANGLKNNRIREGKTLMIPIAAGSTLAAEGKAGLSADMGTGDKIVHRVTAGDTLWSIARRYRVRVAELMDWNQISANQVLSLNQALTVFLN